MHPRSAWFAPAALALLLVGCRERPAPPVPPAPVAPPAHRPVAEDAAAPAPPDDPAARRRELLEAEWRGYREVRVTHDASALTAREQELLVALQEAAALVEELFATSLEPRALAWRAAVEAAGGAVEQAIVRRYRTPWCLDNGDPACTAWPAAGPRTAPGRVFWPEAADARLDERLRAAINATELLSPFTVVREDGRGGFVAIPFARFAPFAKRLERLAAALGRAARAAPHPSLARFLDSRAAALTADDPFPFDASDLDWLDVQGDWEVTVGPYETYRDPRGIKASYQLVVGREDRALSAELERLAAALPAMHEALAALVGPEIALPERPAPTTRIRAIEVWLAAGEARRERGALLAYHLPNRGRAAEAGLSRKVLLVNHVAAFHELSRARAALFLDGAGQGLVDERAEMANAVLHELAHGLGVTGGDPVRTAKGALITVQQALGDEAALCEELKATALGLWLIGFAREQGWIDGGEAARRRVSLVLHLLGLLQFPISSLEGRVAAVALGGLVEAGAVVWDRASSRWRIDQERLAAAAGALTREVTAAQLHGDGLRARSLVTRYVSPAATDPNGPAGVIGRAREAMLAAFQKAGLASPTLSYEISGLSAGGPTRRPE